MLLDTVRAFMRVLTGAELVSLLGESLCGGMARRCVLDLGHNGGCDIRTLVDPLPMSESTCREVDERVVVDAVPWADVWPLLSQALDDYSVAVENRANGHDYYRGDIARWESLPAELRARIEARRGR